MKLPWPFPHFVSSLLCPLEQGFDAVWTLFGEGGKGQFLRTSFMDSMNLRNYQRWSRGHKARGQGQGHKKNPRPGPRTAFPRTDTLEAKDRNARGQGQGPRTQAQVLSKKKKKSSSQKFFRRSPKKKKKKKHLHKNFSSDLHKKTFSKKFFKRYTKF